MNVYPIATSPFRERIENSEHLNAGFSLIQRLKSDLVIPDGILPIIAGGAVRDVVLKNTTPHDVDIFFIKTAVINQTTEQAQEESLQLKDQILTWLESENISWVSRRQSRDYVGSSQTYLEIAEFVLDGITFQLMIPEYIQLADQLLSRFPTSCYCAATEGKFLVSPQSWVSNKIGNSVIISSTDSQYVDKKYPNDPYVDFVNVYSMYAYFLGRMEAASPLSSIMIQRPTGTSRASSRNRFGGSIDTTMVRIEALMAQEFGEKEMNRTSRTYNTILFNEIPTNYRRNLTTTTWDW